MLSSVSPPTSLQVPLRSQALRENLLQKARVLGADAKFPKTAELCAELGVSPTTLNRVLGELEEEGVLVRRRAVGIFVAPDASRSAKIALICDPDFFRASHSPFYDQILAGLRESVNEVGGYEMHFSSPDDAQNPLPANLLADIQSHRIGGVLGVGLNEFAAMAIMDSGVPLVNLFGKGHVIVVNDDAMETRLAAESLALRGCRSIGLWMHVQPYALASATQHVHRNVRGYLTEALAALNMELSPALVEDNAHLFEKLESRPFRAIPSSSEQGFETARRVFCQPRETWPDGLYINNDLMTHGALVALRQIGIEVGRDVQIVAHANVGSPVLIGETGLLTVEHDAAQIARIMLENLARLHKMPSRALVHDQMLFVPPQSGLGISI